jgi:intein-encoded DNA endonuclease-like protein
MEVALTSISHPPADGSEVNFRRLALADGNYVISVGFSSSQRKLLWPMKSFIFHVVIVYYNDSFRKFSKYQNIMVLILRISSYLASSHSNEEVLFMAFSTGVYEHSQFELLHLLNESAIPIFL